MIDRTIQLNECKLHYQQCGEECRSLPILFLHGWGISAEPYGEVLEQLGKIHPVYAPDLPSFARSEYDKLIPDYKTYAAFLVEFLDKLNLEQVHLVGHSFGGGISLTIAALFPERVKSLALLGSTGIPTVSVPEIIPRRAIEMTAQLALPKPELKFATIPKVFTHNLLTNTANLLQALLLSLYGDLRHLLPSIQTPALLLWSDKDLTEPLAIANEMATLLPNSRLAIVPEGFHEWGLWYPEKFTSMVLEFTQQIERYSFISR
ncbi:alpha/beta fold hydrolase [Leptolyngbya sp. NIES-2104]|uniref:alpha/beta fold hydrolase n=1 Tax=Leptolyngbya sp. NIES-2104 TaxID=1552121 RepID=UPI0006EC7AC3|nr:alpha/beta hydrolase [Leptolyngbya sp. NIES-2104]GAP95186.1 2-hydroxymuconic semialdehyde hydrolase [Leptolyngbya sp. NIES-2104]